MTHDDAIPGGARDGARLFVLHRHRLFCESLLSALGDRRDVVLLGSCSDPGQALDHVAASRADVLLVDARLPATTPVDVVMQVRDALPQVAVMVLGVEESDALGLIEAGASAYLPPDAHLDALIDAVLALRRGRAYCSQQVAAAVFARLAALAPRGVDDPAPALDGDSALTAREQQVLRLVGEGLQNKEIAHVLDIAVPTVKNHVHRILDKMRVSRRRDAVQRACEAGLIEDTLPLRPADRGPATRGPATRGPATRGPTTRGPATRGPATRGPATRRTAASA